MGIACEVNFFHPGWNKISNGISKKCNWSGSLGLRSINSNLVVFLAESKAIYDQFSVHQEFKIGKVKIKLSHWREDDAHINKVNSFEESHWIGIRRLLLRFGISKLSRNWYILGEKL